MENNSCKKICRFCLDTSDGNFETIDEITLANLDFLWLKLNLSISEAPVMCGDCTKTIKISSDFKSKCLEIENCIISSVNDTASIKIDLREVLRKMFKKCIDNIPNDHIVCRFCLELVKTDLAIFLRNCTDFVQILGSFRELDLTCTEDPIICAACQVSLQTYFSFVNTCLTTEEKIVEYCKVEGTNGKGQIDLNRVIHFISKGSLKCEFEVGTFKIEGTYNEDNHHNTNNDVEIKTEEILHMELDIKEDGFAQESELTSENSSHHHPRPPQSDYVQLTRAIPENYTCEIFSCQNNGRGHLQKHILAHKDIVQEAKSNEYLMLRHEYGNTTDVGTQVAIYKCNLCHYEAKKKCNLKKHMHIHKSPLEVTMYTCNLCDYDTKYKGALRRHMLTHKTRTEITMYKCEACAFKTKHKESLQRHVRVHMDKSKIEIHKCGECPYESIWKNCLRKHLLSHRKTPIVVTPNTVSINYMCDLCSYETTNKSNLRRHMVMHKSPLEITMYKCDLCNYETKWPYDVKRHMLTHKIR